MEGPDDALEMSPVRRAPFLGRTAESATLNRFLEEIRQGNVGMLLVEAEAGAGKTTLIDHFVDTVARPAGFTVCAGSGDPNDTRMFQCIGDAFDCRPTSTDPLRARIAQVLRSVTLTSAGADGATVATATGVLELFVDLVERVALAAPTLIVLDDLQWADGASLGFLVSVVRRLRGATLGIVGAARPSRRLRGAIDACRPHVVALGPLDDADITQLLEARLGHPSSPELRHSLRSVQDNPFLLTMVAAATSERRAGLEQRAGAAEVFRALAADLEPPLRSFLELGAIAGRTIDADALASASGRPLAEIVSLVRRGVRAGWLAATADGEVEFRHDLLVEALVGSLPIDRRDVAHLRLGRALAGLGHAPGRAAFHLDAASYLLDRSDVALLRPLLLTLPADDPLTFALADRAHDLDSGDRDLLGVVMRCLAVRHRHADAVTRAERWLRRPGAVPDDVGTVRLWMAASLAVTLGSTEVIRLLESWIDSGEFTPTQQAQALNSVARLHWHARDSHGVLETATRALDASRAARYLEGEILALCSRSEAASLLGDAEPALADARAAQSLVPAAAVDEIFWPSLALGTALAAAGRMREGLPLLTRSLRAAERRGDPQAMVLAHVAIGASRFHIGEWDEFVAEADAMTEIGRETGTRTGIVLPLGFAAAVAVRRGRFDEVGRLAARARAENTLGDLHPGAVLGMGLVELAELETAGSVAQASQYAGVFTELLVPTGASAHGLVIVDAARLAWQCGDRATLARMADIASRAGGAGQPLNRRAIARFAAALRAGDAGELIAAAEMFGDTERAWDAATSRHLAGLASMATGPARAGALLDDAAARYDALGCPLHAQLAVGGRGFDGLYASEVARPAHGQDELSAAELRVLRLVADGLANGDIADALFVSKRTVESHIAALYRKLGVETRVALTRAGEAALEQAPPTRPARPRVARSRTGSRASSASSGQGDEK